MASAASQSSARPRLARSTAIFSAATGLSRLLGLIREIVAAYYFGVSGNFRSVKLLFERDPLPRPRIMVRIEGS